MAVQVSTIIKEMNIWAPLSWAEDWDNVGLQVGRSDKNVKKALLALTPGADVIAKAIEDNYDCIITHHPLIFKALKQITDQSVDGRKVLALAQHDVALMSFHTNLDIAFGGVNDVLAEAIGLENISPFVFAGKEKYYKLVVYVPDGYEEEVREAICANGAGWIGKYSDCSFRCQGKGTFKPLEGTKPFLGEINNIHKADEWRLETIVPAGRLNNVIAAMLKAHPYEEAAYDVFEQAFSAKERSIGRVGEIAQECTLKEFLARVAKSTGAENLSYSGNLNRKLKKAALCGGSGCSYLTEAKKIGADVYLTGDVKFHDFQLAKELDIALIDGGHFHTEHLIVEKMKQYLQEKFPEVVFELYNEQDFRLFFQE